jgi:hypothetical protein
MKELCDVVPILNRKRPKIGLQHRIARRPGSTLQRLQLFVGSPSPPELEPPLWFAGTSFSLLVLSTSTPASRLAIPTTSKSSPPPSLRRHGSRKTTLKASPLGTKSWNERRRQLRRPYFDVGRLLDLPSFDLYNINWVLGIVGHLQRPVLTGPKPAVYVFEYPACDNSGLSPRSFIIRKFFANIVGTGACLGNASHKTRFLTRALAPLS